MTVGQELSQPETPLHDLGNGPYDVEYFWLICIVIGWAVWGHWVVQAWRRTRATGEYPPGHHLIATAFGLAVALAGLVGVSVWIHGQLLVLGQSGVRAAAFSIPGFILAVIAGAAISTFLTESDRGTG